MKYELRSRVGALLLALPMVAGAGPAAEADASTAWRQAQAASVADAIAAQGNEALRQIRRDATRLQPPSLPPRDVEAVAVRPASRLAPAAGRAAGVALK